MSSSLKFGILRLGFAYLYVSPFTVVLVMGFYIV
jgi:hypothetical protein